MTQERVITRVAVPATTVLTAQVLTAAMQKLSTCDIENAVETLITVLDQRVGDSDLELEPDEDDD